MDTGDPTTFKSLCKKKRKRIRHINKRISFLDELNGTLTDQKIRNKYSKEIGILAEEREGIEGFLKDAEKKIADWFNKK